MRTPVKHGAISLGVHLIAVIIMLVVFKWGIYSLVVGNIVFSLSMCILNARTLGRTIQYKQEVKQTFVIPLCAAIIMGVAVIGSYYGAELIMPKKLATILSIAVAMIAYLVSLIKLGAIRIDEIRSILKLNKK